MDRGIEVWGGVVSMPIEGDGERALPVVRRVQARISGETLAKLIAPAGIEGRLVEGGVVLRLRLPLAHVTAELVGSAPGNGRLRLEAVSLRLGDLLPLPVGLAELAIQRITGQPGVHRAGPHTIDLDLAELLSALPLRWEAGIRRARITTEFLEIECAEP